jgi:MoxR-like ATPase
MRLDQLLDATTRARVPALVWGAPGVGKTAAIRGWAARRGLRRWTVIAAYMGAVQCG